MHKQLILERDCILELLLRMAFEADRHAEPVERPRNTPQLYDFEALNDDVGLAPRNGQAPKP